MPSPSTQPSQFTFWILDVRALWPGDSIADSASHALETLPASERARALRFHFPADQRLSLASALLKRTYISRTLAVPWTDISFARKGDAQHGKPTLLQKSTLEVSVDFNVSHQAGLTSLVAATYPREQDIEVGTDIIRIDERGRDRVHISRDGFEGWVRMHAEVFSEADLAVMTSRGVDGVGEGAGAEAVLRAKMRRFYAFWALKEAYVKMTGEALVSGWLKDVGFEGVVVPDVAVDGAWGGVVSGIRARRKGVLEGDVVLYLQAFEERYMIATAIKGGVLNGEPEYKVLDLERDVLAYAHAWDQ